MNHDIEKLARQIEGLQYDLGKIAGSDTWKELLKLIHFKGYTTPSEFFLVSNLVINMHEQVHSLIRQQDALLEGSHLILAKTEFKKTA